MRRCRSYWRHGRRRRRSGASVEPMLLDDIEAPSALAVDLIGELTRLPQGESAAHHRIVAGLGVGKIDTAQRHLGRSAIRPAEAQRPALRAARLDHKVEAGSLGVGDLPALGWAAYFLTVATVSMGIGFQTGDVGVTGGYNRWLLRHVTLCA